MRLKALARCLMIVCVLSLIGCRNSATSPDPAVSSNQNAGNATTTAYGNSGAPEGSGMRKAPESVLAHAFTPKPIVVNAGKEIVITADQSVSSKTSNPGDFFDASIAEPVMVGEKVVIPKGAKATGTVTEAKSAGKFKGNAAITLTLSSVTVHGEEYRLKTSQVTESGKGRGKRTAVGAGGGAAVGAIIGAIAGGGKGAAIGAGAGAGAGTAGAAYTGDKDITIAPETKLTFELREPLEVRKK
jgi:hypothetical protein